MDASTLTTKHAWHERRDMAKLLAGLVERQEKVMQRLARYREDNAPPGKDRMTQEDASEKAGVAVRQWQRWEAGETMPHARNLEQLASKLDIPITDFIGEGGDQTNGETPDLAVITGNRRRKDDTDLAELQAQLARIEQNQTELATALDAISAQIEATSELSESKFEEVLRAVGRRGRRAS